MAYTIRPFATGDAAALARVAQASIRQTGAVAYTPEQVAAWAARHRGPEMLAERAVRALGMLVAADADDQPVGYALLEADGHLDHLYMHPDHGGKGLALRLLAESEQIARTSGCTRLYTEASELARPVFEKSGYEVIERRDLEIDGVAIHNYAMEKPIG